LESSLFLLLISLKTPYFKRKIPHRSAGFLPAFLLSMQAAISGQNRFSSESVVAEGFRVKTGHRIEMKDFFIIQQCSSCVNRLIDCLK